MNGDVIFPRDPTDLIGQWVVRLYPLTPSQLCFLCVNDQTKGVVNAALVSKCIYTQSSAASLSPPEGDQPQQSGLSGRGAKRRRKLHRVKTGGRQMTRGTVSQRSVEFTEGTKR